MRNTTLFSFVALLAAVVVSSCNKNDENVNSANPDEICFSLDGDGLDMSLQTKADAVTSLSSIYWEAASGGTVRHAVASYTVTDGSVSTGLYWPVGEVTYDYMASNVAFTTSTGTITADNATDIVAGTATGITRSTSASITLDHIFARTGTVSLSPEDETYTVSDVSWTIASNDNASGTAGTYTIGSGWGTTATTVLSQQTFTSESDLYIIPASYTVGVTFTLSKGSYSETFTKTAALTFIGGKVNNIVGTVGKIGSAKEIVLSVNVTSWGSNDLTPTFE